MDEHTRPVPAAAVQALAADGAAARQAQDAQNDGWEKTTGSGTTHQIGDGWLLLLEMPAGRVVISGPPDAAAAPRPAVAFHRADLPALIAALQQIAAPDAAAHFWQAAAAELDRARQQHPPIHSAHEGYAVLLEEVEEFWLGVKAQQPDPAAMRAELLQIAAMAARVATDVLGAAGNDDD
jgi:hypothetical protein